MSYSHEWGAQRKIFLAPPPGALGRGQKVKYHLISITKSISKIFIPNFVCVLTNERYKTYQTFFFILSPGSCPRVGTWGYLGAKIKFQPAVYPLCYLLLDHWTKFNQIWCVSYSHEWGAQRKKKIWAPPPGSLGRGQKVKYHSISITKSISRFLFQTLCDFSQMKVTKHIRGVYILSPGSCLRGGTWGYLGAKIKFRPAVCPLGYLLLNHWTKFNQIWCVSYLHKWGAQRKNKI